MRRSNGSAESLARALGWFSIGLGLAEILAPRRVGSALGMPGSERLIQASGLREIAIGVAILSAENRAPWIWSRVAGDALDLATLASGLDSRNTRAVTVAAGAAAAVTLLDVCCARQLGREDRRRPARDYSNRSGFPQSPQRMRGIAAAARRGSRHGEFALVTGAPGG